MKSSICLLFVLAACSSASEEEAKNPGIRIRVTNKALQYASVLASGVLNKEVPKIVFPTISLPINEGPGEGQVNVAKIAVTEFIAPKFSYSLNPPSGMVWRTRGGSISISADWWAWYKILFKINLTGSIKASVDNIQLTLGANVFRTSTGLPEVNVTTCSAKFNDLKVEIGGGVVQYVVNLFRSQISSRLKSTLETQLCVGARGALQDFANKELQSLPTIIPLYKDFYLHYGLTDNPKVEDEYVESNIRAEITWRGQNATPVVSHGLPEVLTPSNASRMLYLWGSDYVLNTFLYSAQQHGAIKFLVSKELDPQTGKFLRTTCPLICIGTVIPEIGERYPNSSVEFAMYTKDAPVSEIQPDGAFINGTAYVNAYNEPYTEAENLMFIARIRFSAELDVFMRRGRVAGNISFSQITIDLVQSQIGHIPQDSLDLIAKVATPALEDLANHHMNRGIKIPTVEGVGLARPELHLLTRSLLVETDIRYKRFWPKKVLPQYTHFK